MRTIHAPGCLAPIFIILSASTEEGCRDRFQVESALGMDLVSSPQCRIVHCNGIPTTKLKKALKHIVGSEGYGGEDIDRGIEDIIISARGDLRHAITEMQFFCSSFQRAPKALLKRTRKSGKRKRKMSQQASIPRETSRGWHQGCHRNSQGSFQVALLQEDENNQLAFDPDRILSNCRSGDLMLGYWCTMGQNSTLRSRAGRIYGNCGQD